MHLPTWADRRRTFERVAASLLPDGRFAWNVFVFDHQIAVRDDGTHQDHPVPHTLRYSVPENRIDILRDDGARSFLWWGTKTSGWACWTAQASTWKPCTEASPASRSTTTVASTSS
jgi:hypothetical protein